MSNLGHKRSKGKKLSPGIRPGESIPFYKLDEILFQELSRDLFHEEPNIATCDIYGVPGQSQEGIDLLATRSNNEGVEVGQCKCYKDFSPALIRDASDEFFKYWDRWSTENVKRFVLFVASDLDTTQKQNQILSERKRFGELGIVYEVWTAATIRNKLRPHPGIVANYLKPAEYWVKEICGTNLAQSPFVGSETGFSTVISTAVELQFETLIQNLSKETKQTLMRMRDAWREGEKAQVLEWINELRNDISRWGTLTVEIKAQVLRFEAGLKLDTNGDISIARQLADAAYQLDPSSRNEARIRSLITHYEFGPERAVPYLEGLNDLDNLNLLSAYYLELNNKVSCQKTISYIEETLTPNAETYRLKALLALALGNSQQARLLVEKALSMAPKWVVIHYAKAIIGYFSAISPAAFPPDQFPLWPEPVDWIMVNRDDASLQILGEATQIFKQLMALEEHGKDADLLQAWYLACLMVDPQKQGDAHRQAQSMLISNPCSYYAIAWIVMRNLDIDLAPCQKCLEKLLALGTGTVPHIIALVGIFLRQREFDKAVKILLQSKEVFITAKAESLWILWNVQVLVLAGRPKKAQQILNRHKDDSIAIKQAQGIILAAQANKSKSTFKLIKYLEEQYEQTKDPVFILQACETELRKQNWEYITKFTEFLIKEFRTAEVLRLVAISTYNAKQYGQCLVLLNNNQDLFGHAGMPADLRRIRAACLQALGKLRDAIAEIESLPQEYQTIDQLRQMVQMYLQIGDLKKIALIGRQFISMPEINPDEALWMAHVLRQEDSILAKSFWHKAVSQKLPDRLIGNAVFIGFNLGLDKELREISREFLRVANAGTGGLTSFASLEDFAEFYKSVGSQSAKIATLYQEGKLPVHALAEREGILLADLYLEYLTENEAKPEPLKQTSLLIRHASKEIDTNVVEKSDTWQLHVDITSILLAEHLNILELVIDAFHPIYIPSEVIPSLVEMRDKVLHHQPSQLITSQEIVDFIESGQLKVVDIQAFDEVDRSTEQNVSLDTKRKIWFDLVKKQGGYILDFQSELKTYTSYHQIDDEAPIVSARDIANSLFESGKLSGQEFDAKILELGREGDAYQDPKPPKLGSSIYCFANVIDVLSGAGLLNLACEHFNVYVQSDHYERLKGTLAYHKRRQARLFQHLGELIDKLRDNVELERLQIIPPENTSSSSKKEQEFPALYGLRSLYTFPPKSNDVIWIDDRFMNGFSNRDGVPLVGVNEILAALLRNGRIDQSKYYKLRNRLRASNLRFVPVERDEIIYHLRNTSIRNGSLIETSDLEVLKKYIATVLVQGKILQKPPMPGESTGEFEYVLQLGRAIIGTLAKLWAVPDIENPERAIYAEWIIRHLYTTHLGISNTIGMPQNAENDLLFTSLSYELLLTEALVMDLSSQADKVTPRKEYLTWVYDRLLKNHFDANAPSFKATASLMRRLIQASEEELIQDGVPQKDANNLYQQFCSLLPDPIFEELSSDTEFNRILGVESQVTVGEFVLTAKDFWEAVHTAVNGDEAEILPQGRKTPIAFKPFQDENTTLSVLVLDPENKEPFSLGGPELLLLTDKTDLQEKVLRDNRRWFDCSDEEFIGVSAQITSARSPEDRVQMAIEWRDADLNLYYQNLYNKLRQQKSFIFSDLIPPSVKGMMRHYRLHTGGIEAMPFAKLWEDIANELMNSETLTNSLSRLWSVPIALPQVVFEKIKQKSRSERRILIKHLLKSSSSPVALIHMIKLLFEIGVDEPIYGRLAKLKLSYLMTEDFFQEIETFLPILRWVRYRFSLVPEIQAYSPRIQLFAFWSHAHELSSIFSSLGIAKDWIQNTFSQDFQLPMNAFEDGSSYESDISNPQKVNSKIFHTYGIVYCSKGHSKLLDEKLREEITQLLTIEVQGNYLPHPLLLQSPEMMPNSIEAFFGFSLREYAVDLTKNDIADLFQHLLLVQFVRDLVQGLQQNMNERSAWINLFAIIRTSRQEMEIKGELINVLSNIDFIDLFAKDWLLGATAIQVASYLVIAVDNQSILISYLKNQILESTKLLAKAYPPKDIEVLNIEKQTEIRQAMGLLIDATLNLSKREKTGEDRVVAFKELSLKLIDIWGYVATVIRPIVQLFCEVLPPAQAKHMWSLLLILRAM